MGLIDQSKNSALIKARVVPLVAASLRFLVIILFSYVCLFILTCLMERFIISHKNVDETLNKTVAELRTAREFDRKVREVSTRLYLQEEKKPQSDVLMKLYTKSPPSLKKIEVNSPYQFKDKKVTGKEGLISLTLSSNLWRRVHVSFMQALKLLVVAQVSLMCFLGVLGFLRSISIYPKDRYIVRGFVFTFSVLPIFVIASLPDPFISRSARPGYSILELFQISGTDGAPLFYSIWQIVFIICFAGITSIFAIESVIKDTPEENLNYYRGGTSAKWNAMRLTITRSSAQLEEWVPFFVIAVLFCRARLTNVSDNISLFVSKATKADNPIISLPNLIMFIAIILMLTWICRALFRFFQEAFLPINLDGGVR